MAQLALFISVRTKPGKRSELAALWNEHLRPRAEANADQSTYVYAFDAQDENLIHITEVYETAEAFQANAQADWFADYMAAAGDLIDGPPTVHMGHPQWVK